ncbi:2-amino-4-hydroxy-6-hydroxymethyldihydropteridine diphosphokinase [Halomonas korlensis]|uniref:2-amino-4-hydroxy-6-hydroxymethyldihydropteridine pyrophosphokinase n=1 Tax=Halomonas korlensis TaxID=463301 RepID=A0A1I7K9Y4_9GAMM|nr:2-amino-4-hydroxy-6-hydroxymethyldihydropteridine diphosphokinase [Halomonas korlensis]SFU94217.1 2-amino-4-hydroxy-6-hydroxymethyldihydropteridinediphosphokinase [Halomonas korlensis]
MSDQRAWIGLGSNLDDPLDHVVRALQEIDRLPLTRRLVASSCYKSRPVGPADQPDFINAVAMVATRLSPLALLDQLQAVEQRHGRVRQRHWGPRTLDLDLLLFDDYRLTWPRLTLPHPELAYRAFVLLPLADVAPELRLPDGRSVARLAAALGDHGVSPMLPGA